MAERLCPIAKAAKHLPHHPALVTDTTAWTYREVDRIIGHFCSELSSQGIQRGSRVAFVAKKIPQTIFLLFALFRLKATACPLSYREPPEKIPSLLKQLSHTHYIDPEKFQIQLTFSASSCTVDDESLATMLFTSGSSGMPKIACHYFKNHFFSAFGANLAMNYDNSSIILLSLPFFHVGGLALLFRGFLSGATLVLSELSFLEAICRHRATHCSLVPTQLFRLLQNERSLLKEAKQTLRCLLLGGAATSITLLNQAKRENLPLFNSYGLTEMSSIVTLQKEPSAESIGKPILFRELNLSENEIMVRGETFFAGYWNMQSEQCELSLNDGWFATKDLAEQTETGELKYLGRKDRLFISGGENVHPEEIEQVILNLGGIVQAAVLSFDDPEFGKRPVAFIQDEVQGRSHEQLKEMLKSSLPHFKIPMHFFPFPSFNGMKPSYVALRELLSEKQS